MDIELYFEKLSKFDRVLEPCTVAIPFSQGEVKEASMLVVFDGEEALPTQARATATWPDGSVRWALVHFLANLPANSGKSVMCKLAPKQPKPSQRVSCKRLDHGAIIKTGPLEVALAGPGDLGLFDMARLDDATIVEHGELMGPMLFDGNNTCWMASCDESGWRVLENGPVRVTVQAHGKHYSDEEKTWQDFTLVLYAYAGEPWVRLDYRIINKEAPDESAIERAGLVFRPGDIDPAEVRTALATSNYRSRIRVGEEGATLRHVITAEQLQYEANEQIPEVFYGTFWADWCGPRGGVALTIFQAHQNFPKGLHVDGRRLEAWLVPAGEHALHLMRGMAKSHRILLHFHDEETSPEEINVRSLQFQMPDRPVLSRVVYQQAKIFPDLWPKKSVQRVERCLIDLADGRTRGYGMLHWGDGPDAGYTHQGRGRGELVWTNNEYDLPHAALLMYIHTGERRMLDYLLVAAEHWMDVDVCHFSDDPLRFGGQVTHSAKHATGGVGVSHQWVEGLLDYYHQTGDGFALETALGIGRNILRHLEKPNLWEPGAASARETGWALRSLVALYREMRDEAWLQPAEWIVEHFRAWQEKYGAWLAPYTDHTLVRVPFMIAVAVNSLMRYHWLRPSDMVADMVVAAANDLLTHCLTPDGRFYYKELPSLRRRGGGALVLEALAHAFDLTGEAKYIKAGLPTFDLVLADTSGSGAFTGPKFVAGDAVAWPRGPGPKAFAQTCPPLMFFYRAAVDAGVLTPEPSVEFQAKLTQDHVKKPRVHLIKGHLSS